MESKPIKAEYLIPDCNIPKLIDAIDALNKRARRLGVQEITTTKEHDHYSLEVISPLGARAWVHEDKPGTCEQTGTRMAWYRLTVEGQSPCYNGWHFVATLAPLPIDNGDTVNVVRAVPGESCPTEYRDRAGDCDHCKTHRTRKETFVVQHEDGHSKMVGRSCIKDFLGHKDPHTLASWAEMLATLEDYCSGACDESWGGGGCAPSSWTLETFLSWTASVIRQHGWTSGKVAYEQGGESTKSQVLEFLIPPNPVNDGWRADHDKHVPTDEDKEKTTAALAWVEGLKDNGEELNDYLYNLSLVARAGYVKTDMAGYAASIFVAHDKTIARKKKQAAILDEHLGEVKKRMTLTVTVDSIIRTDTYYGLMGIHKMHDEDGRQLVWFASESAAWLKEQETHTVKATVKSHGDYNGLAQTVINRVQVTANKADKKIKK